MAGTWVKRAGWGVGGAVVAVAAYLAAWPVPIQPVAWTAPAAPGYQGVHAPNQRLAQLNIIDLKGEVGPEHIAFGKDGKLYTTVLSGNILRMNPDGSGQEVFANTGGRVLGVDFDAAGNLIAADAVKGLLSIAPDGKLTVLADKVGLSATPVWRRVKELEDSGVIRRHVALVDREKLGLNICVLANVSLVRHSEGAVEQFEQLVLTSREIIECHGITGEADYVIKVVVPDMDHYQKLLLGTLTRIEGVSSVRSSFVLDSVIATTELPLEHLRG